MLIQLYLLSPILVLFVRNWWKPTLIISALVQVVFLFFSYILTLNPALDWLSEILGNVLIFSYIFWFCFGIFVGLHFTKFNNTLVKYKRVFLIGIFLFFIAGVVEWEVLFNLSGQDWISPRETLIDQIYSLFVILTFLTFEKIPFPWFEQITGVSTRSYAIYLIHTLVLISIAKIIYSFAPSVMEYQILFFPILVFFGLGIPLLLTYLVEKSFIGKYYKYLVG
jgi:membrane-bound acyltransferase YfiQ involved in biofilm formation